MIEYLKDNVWVWAGTALVLLTLSGTTLKRALMIVIASIVIHLLFTLLQGKKD